MIKEEQIKENLKDISKMENKISVLENENENLKNHVAESETVLKRDTKKQKRANTKLLLSSMNSEKSDNGVVNKAGCDKCNFTATD